VSAEGVKLAAAMFSQMQQTRYELLKMASVGERPSQPEFQQDILLARLFEDANDYIKDRFSKIVSGEIA